MATVRLTEELKDQIRSNARQGFNAREQSNHQRFHQLIDREQLKRDTLEVMLEQYGMSEELYDAIPSGWLPERKELSFSKLNDYNVSHVIGAVECNPPMKMHNALSGESYYSRSLSLTDPRFSKYVEIAQQHDASGRAIASEKEHFMIALNALFRKCNTLKQALELFPNLEKLVPASVMERHNEKSEKRAKVELTTEGVDLDALSATLVRNRLHTAIS